MPKNNLFRDHPAGVLLIGGILLLIGILVGAHSTLSTITDYVGLFLKELGFALIIAFALTIGIEKASRERHNSQIVSQIATIKENVFEAVYSTRQDRTLVSLLETEIFKKAFFRSDYELTMTLSFVEQASQQTSESMVRVDVCSRFYVINTMATSQEYVFITFLERPFDQALEHKAVLSYLKVRDQVLSTEEIDKADAALDDTLDFRQYRHPVRIAGGEKVQIVAKYTIFKHCRDCMIWQSIDPSDGLRLKVFHPKEIVIFGDPVHPTPHCGDKNGGGREDVTFDLRITLPLLPGNGMQLWWSLAKDIPKEVMASIESDVAESQHVV